MHLITIYDHHKTSLRSWSKPFKSFGFWHIFSAKTLVFQAILIMMQMQKPSKKQCFFDNFLFKNIGFYKLFEASSKKLHHWGEGGTPLLRSGLATIFWIAVTYYIVRGWRRLQKVHRKHTKNDAPKCQDYLLLLMRTFPTSRV